MDVTTAYLHSSLEEEIYVKPPEEVFESRPVGVWKPKKAMYGLKQSGRAWNNRLNTTLKQYGLEKSKADPCIYFKEEGDKKLIVTIYVDDLLIFTNDNKEERKLKETLQRNFEMKDLEKARDFLGMNIKYERAQGVLQIDQEDYIKKILKKFRMAECNSISTSADPNARLSAKKKDEDLARDKDLSKLPFKEAVGSLLYLSQISRPDIAFAVNQVSSFCANPSLEHWNTVKRIFRYLKGTLEYKLKYTKDSNSEITGYNDADWANSMDRKSHTGSVFIVNAEDRSLGPAKGKLR